MQCSICKSSEVALLKKDFCGYDVGDVYEIYACKSCKAHFATPNRVPDGIYERLHSHASDSVYNTLFDRAQGILNAKDPFGFLLDDIHSYYPVKKAIEGKQNLKILEIGCSNGYLVHALRSLGHNAQGIDLSSSAIDFAQKNFGDHFANTTIEDFVARRDAVATEGKFDLVIALEVIEHLTDVEGFLKNIFSVLKPGGSFICTTPNRQYFSGEAIWRNDQPPVHLLWFSPATFEYLGKTLNAKVNFVDFKDHVSWNEDVNELYSHFSRQSAEHFPEFFFQKKFDAVENDDRQHRSLVSRAKGSLKSVLKRTAKKALVKNSLIRNASTQIFRKFLYKDLNDFWTIGVEMKPQNVALTGDTFTLKK